MLSFGCGEDISFDVAMAATYDIQVYLFDPTPRAKVHVESVLKAIATKYAPQKSKHKRGDHYVAVDGEEHEISDKVDARGFFDKIVQSNVDRSQFHYAPWALSDKDGEMSFMSPKSGVSHVFSAVGRDKSNMEGEITVPVKSMASILKLKHIRKVDLIKIDIEGYENKVIPGMLELIKTWPIEDWPKVLMFDFDSMLSGHAAEDQAGGRKSVALVEAMGYSVFSGSPTHPDYTFVLNPTVAKAKHCSGLKDDNVALQKKFGSNYSCAMVKSRYFCTNKQWTAITEQYCKKTCACALTVATESKMRAAEDAKVTMGCARCC